MISICKYCGGTAPEGTDICRNCLALLKIADSTVSSSDTSDSTDMILPRETAPDSSKHPSGESTAPSVSAQTYDAGTASNNRDDSTPTDADASELAGLATLSAADAEESTNESKADLSISVDKDQQQELSVLAEISENAHAAEEEEDGGEVISEPIVIVPPVINELFTLDYISDSALENTTDTDVASYISDDTIVSEKDTNSVKRESEEITAVSEEYIFEDSDSHYDNNITGIDELATEKSAEHRSEKELGPRKNSSETDNMHVPGEAYISIGKIQETTEPGERSPICDDGQSDTEAQSDDTLPTVFDTNSDTNEEENELSNEWVCPKIELITDEWAPHNTDTDASVLWSAPLADIIKNPWSVPKADIIPAERLEAAGLTAKDIAVETLAEQDNTENSPKKSPTKTLSNIFGSFIDALKKIASTVARSGMALKKASVAAARIISLSAKGISAIACKTCWFIKKAALATRHFLIGKSHDKTVFDEHIGMREIAICCTAYLPFMFPIPTILIPSSKFMRYHSICGAVITVTVIVIQIVSVFICYILESVFTSTVNIGTSFEHTAINHGGFNLIASIETASLVLIFAVFIHALSMAVFHRKNILAPELFYRLAERGAQNAKKGESAKKPSHGKTEKDAEDLPETEDKLCISDTTNAHDVEMISKAKAESEDTAISTEAEEFAASSTGKEVKQIPTP